MLNKSSSLKIGEGREKKLLGIFFQLISFVPELVGAILLGFLIIFLVISVISRYAMDLGIPWSDELARILFTWIVLLGFAIAVRKKSNVGVDWLIDKFPSSKRNHINVIQDVIVLGFSLIFTWQSWVTVQFSLMQQMPTLEITIAWLYGSALVGGILMTIYSINNLYSSIRCEQDHSSRNNLIAE